MAGFYRNGRKVTLVGDDGQKLSHFDISDGEAVWGSAALMIAGVVALGFSFEARDGHAPLPHPLPELLFLLGLALFVAGIIVRMLPSQNAERATRFERNHQRYR